MGGYFDFLRRLLCWFSAGAPSPPGSVQATFSVTPLVSAIAYISYPSLSESEMAQVLYIGAAASVDYMGASSPEGSFLNSGTATWTLFDSNHTPLATGTLTYQPGSNGNYVGVIPGTTTQGLSEGFAYYVGVNFAQSNYVDYWEIQYIASYRTSQT